jgi:hypothetical protein
VVLELGLALWEMNSMAGVFYFYFYISIYIPQQLPNAGQDVAGYLVETKGSVQRGKKGGKKGKVD